jgi:pyruvate dehydrogenase E1 component beta subunit
MSHSDELLNQAMLMLALNPAAIFVGQGVAYGGVATYKHLTGIPDSQRLEMPVAEDFQLGFCTGLSLQGFLPISIFPRIDFMLRAADQLVNHLDKLEFMSRGDFKPRVIIRTRVGSRTPLDAGPQHSQDHTAAFSLMLTNMTVYRIDDPAEILPVYRAAVADPRSSLVIEAL